MIIDSHAHVVIPAYSHKFLAELVGSRGNPVRPPAHTEEGVRKAGQSIIDIMDKRSAPTSSSSRRARTSRCTPSSRHA
jgi:hypothetical protein